MTNDNEELIAQGREFRHMLMGMADWLTMNFMGACRDSPETLAGWNTNVDAAGILARVRADLAPGARLGEAHLTASLISLAIIWYAGRRRSSITHDHQWDFQPGPATPAEVLAAAESMLAAELGSIVADFSTLPPDDKRRRLAEIKAQAEAMPPRQDYTAELIEIAEAGLAGWRKHGENDREEFSDTIDNWAPELARYESRLTEIKAARP